MNLELTLAIALLLACLFILWLVWANQQLRTIIKELEDNNANLYEVGVIHGRREATEQYRQSVPYSDGYADGYGRGIADSLERVAEMDALRQSGELAHL